MNKRIIVFWILLFLLIGLGSVSFHCIAETPIIKVISASATSSSDDSLPVTDLLDQAKEGSWKPKALDSGTDEGLFFQFQEPVLIDWIEVKVIGGSSNYWVTYYLDGKRNESGKKKKSRQDSDNNADDGFDDLIATSTAVEYEVANRDTGKDRVLILGAKKRYTYENSEDYVAPLNVKVQSLFIKITAAAPNAKVVSIRFFQKNHKDPLPIKIPLFISGIVKGSSTLSPETAYNILNLFDSRLDFAWATNGNKTNGIGESIVLTLDKPCDLSGLIIWNGYQRSETHYFANARPGKIKVKVNNNEEFNLSLQDKMSSQNLTFPRIAEKVKTLTLLIEDIFKGKSYKDTAVSELRLVDKTGNVVILHTPVINVEVKNPALQKLLNISLAPYMLSIVNEKDFDNEYYYSSFEASFNYPHKSIRFRSNGSFVCYLEYGEIMEGNWEPSDNGVRIFGKRYRTDNYSSIYLQEVKTNTSVKIFQENIEIIDLSKIPFVQAKKYFKSILADRHFYEYFSGTEDPLTWWMGIEPYEKAKITGTSEDEFIKKAYEVAIKQKGILLVSPLFTDLFLPGDQIKQTYDYLP